MNWLSIFCFTSVARTQSFSITARELMISQQAVSQHIRKLEEELGFSLFLRNYQNVVLSKAGQKMLLYFTERERMLDGFTRQMKKPDAEPLLRIAWSQFLGCPDWFQDAITAFRQRNPQLRIQVYDLNAQEAASTLEALGIELFLTTQYAAAYLPLAWRLNVLREIPLVLLGNRKIAYKPDMLSLYPHFAASAGETNALGVLARAQRECARIGLYPQRVEVCPDMGSVCLNVLVQGGLALGVKIRPFAQGGEFLCMPTEQRVTAALFCPYQFENVWAERFARFLRTRMEAKK